MDAVTLLGGACLMAVLVLLPGRAVVYALGLRRDTFAQVLCGVGIVSVVGLLLARAHAFSLGSLALALGAVVIAGGLAAHRAPGGGRADGGLTVTRPAGRIAAGAAALAALLWCWPPFETVLAASDSTMYINAGIHLARSGSLVVESDAVGYLGGRTARSIFPSIRANGTGPFVRLPGGLLMSGVTDDQALPAFFPLLPVWTGIAALVWGPAGAPIIAPLAVALAVWAVALFAAETLGAVVGAVAGALLLANFSFWWFGRFLMPEPLACAFVWGALVVLRRGGFATTGALLGLAGLARAETMLFVVAAVGLWVVWERPRVRVGRLLVGFAPLAFLTGFSLIALPSHHLAYLRNDVGFAIARTMQGVPFGTGFVVVAVVIAALAMLAVAVALRGRRPAERALRVASVLAVAGTLLVYLLVGGHSDPVRSVRWLASYCSWPLLAMAVAGAIVAWRRGDPVVRLALLLCALVALVFGINPRVAPYHPWAIRRFLPIVIPGLTIAAAAAIGVLMESGQRARRLAAALTVLGLVLLEVRPVQAIRHRLYFLDGFRTVKTIAEMLPLDAIVVVDSRLADVQLQVPLWLLHGRETVMLAAETVNWRAALFALTESGRPTYWIDTRRAPDPRVSGLVFERALPNPEIRLLLPNSALDGPPKLMIGRRYPLKIYRVSRAPE